MKKTLRSEILNNHFCTVEFKAHVAHLEQLKRLRDRVRGCRTQIHTDSELD